MLRMIQNKIGGTVKTRSGVQAIRWLLHNRQGMIDLVNRINGYIRHNKRLVQLNNVCAALEIQSLNPDTLHDKHGWFAGFFDADGMIEYYLKGKNAKPQLTLSVTNKLYVDVVHFFTCFGGQIVFDEAKNGYYKWNLESEANISSFLEYAKVCCPQSIKRRRLFLVKDFYRLVGLRCHKAKKGT